MSDPAPIEIVTSDPLGVLARKMRAYLLGVSLVSIVVAATGLVPSEISNLGITFMPNERRAFVVILAGVTVYYLLAFIIYGLSDFLTWSSTFHRTAGEDAATFVGLRRQG